MNKDFQVEFREDDTMTGATLDVGDVWKKNLGTWKVVDSKTI